MTDYYAVIYHGMGRKVVLGVPEEDDEYKVHRYQRADEETIHSYREKANIEVTELDIDSEVAEK